MINWRSFLARPGVFIEDVCMFLILAGIRIFILNIFLNYAVARFRVIGYIYIADKLVFVAVYFICVLSLANNFNSEGSICGFRAIKFKGFRNRNLYRISKRLNRIISRFVELLIAN